MLGQIVKEKARFYQLQRHQQPDVISVKTSELDERVRGRSCDDGRLLMIWGIGQGARYLRHHAVLAFEAVRGERVQACGRYH